MTFFFRSAHAYKKICAEGMESLEAEEEKVRIIGDGRLHHANVNDTLNACGLLAPTALNSVTYVTSEKKSRETVSDVLRF